MPTITFLPGCKTVDVSAGTKLLAAVRNAGIHMETPCNGRGTCGLCIVQVLAGDFETDSRYFIPPDIVEEGFVLACRTRLGESDLVVVVEGNWPGDWDGRGGEKIH